MLFYDTYVYEYKTDNFPNNKQINTTPEDDQGNSR